MDSLELIGSLPPASKMGFRDAIHIPIVVLKLDITDEFPQPGDRVELKAGTRDTVTITPRANYGSDTWIGILDPFLDRTELWKYDYNTGRRRNSPLYVTVFLRPGMSRSVVHVYEHPLLDGVQPVNEHQLWLQDFAQRYSFDYNEMIAEASDVDLTREYDPVIVAKGQDLHGRSELGEDYELFWYHLSKLNNTTYSPDHKDRVRWSCTC